MQPTCMVTKTLFFNWKMLFFDWPFTNDFDVKKYLKEEDRKFIEDNLSELKITHQEYNWGLNIRS